MATSVDELLGMLSKDSGPAPKTDPVSELVGMLPEKERTVLNINPSGGGPGPDFGRVAGALEQIPAGVWGLGSMVGSAAAATMNTFREKLRQWTDGTDPRLQGRAVYQGRSVGQIWTDEYRAASENAASMYVPITPQGAEISRKLGDVMTEAVQWVGDKFYETGVPIPGLPKQLYPHKENPAFGALGQVIATAASMVLLGGAKRSPVRPEPTPTPVEVWQNFEKKYPETTKRVETLGAVRMGDFIASDRTLFDQVHRKLNADLGIDDTGGKIPLQSKVEMVIVKEQPDIPLPEAQKAARSVIDQIAQLDAAREARANALGLPAPKPSPAISPEPVLVDKTGRAITPEQAAARDSAFLDMTPDERAAVLGVSAMGRMRLLHEQIVAAESSGNTAAARKLSNQLKQEWAKTFPYRDVAKRNDALDVFRNFGGRLTWEEASVRMGEPTNVGRARGIDKYGPLGKPKEEAPRAPMTDAQLEESLFGPRKGKPGGRQSGMIDIEGLRYTLGSFNDLPPKEVLKAATVLGAINRQGVTQAEKGLITDIMKGRESITAAELKAEVASNVLPLRAVDTLDYASYGLQNIGVKFNVRWSDPRTYDAPAASQPVRTTIWRMPMESTFENHFGDKQYFAHSRSFDRAGARHIVEVQSDLIQKLKTRRGATPDIPPEQMPVARTALQELLEDADPEEIITGPAELQRFTPETQQILMDTYGRPTPESPWAIADIVPDFERRMFQSGTPKTDDLGPATRLSDRWFERIILEENRRAAEQGVRVMRVADADTVAKVEGWPTEITIKLDDGRTFSLSDAPGADNVWYNVDTGGTVKSGTSLWRELEDMHAAGFSKETLHPDFQGIYRRYRDDIPKLLKQHFDARYVKNADKATVDALSAQESAMRNAVDKFDHNAFNSAVLRVEEILNRNGVVAQAPMEKLNALYEAIQDGKDRFASRGIIANAMMDIRKQFDSHANGWWEWDVRPADATNKILAFGGKGGRQRGALIVEGFDDVQKELSKAGQAAVQGASRAWPVGTEEFEKAAAAKVQATFNETLAMQEEASKRSFSRAADRIKRSVVGHDVTLKDALEQSGAYGEKAKARMVLQRGATDAARIEMEQVNERIFNDLKPEEKKLVDELARARRIIEIDDKKGVGAVKHKEGITGPEAEAWARQLRRTLGDAAYARINGKVNEVFKVYEDLLRDRLADGLIDEKTFDKLLHFDYKPEQFTDLIDPMLTYEIGDRRVSVRASGLQDLSGGGRSPRVLDTQMLLAEAIGRTRNQQFKNRTLNALFELGREQPENGLVRIVGDGKPGGQKPIGHSRIGVMVDGQKREIFMPNELAHELLTNPQPMTPWVGNMINVLSGSATLRATAVGANPIFPLAGLPMDIFHTWMASSRGYSPHLPVYLGQIGADMVSVLGDVVKKGPSYQQAIREGLGTHYSASYGQHVFTRDLTMAERVMPRYEKVLRVLRGFNQEADLLVRLAHRKRLIDQGMSSEMATAVARDRLDYAQGGELIKALDTAIPWTNVSVQALYKVARNAKKDPADFAVKMAWLGGAVASSVLANMITSPETWQSIPARDKVNSLILTFGDQFYVVDPDGNKRYLYVPLRMDQTASPILGTIVGTMEAAEYGRAPSDIVRQSVASSINLFNGVDLIPTLSAGMAMAGLDPFTGKAIADSPHARPSTSPFAKAIGDMTGESPVRLETAFGKVVAASNPWIQLAGGAVKELLFEDDPRTKEKLTEQVVLEKLRPVVKLTNPMTKFMDSVDDAVKAVTDQQVRQRDGLDEILYKVGRGQEPKSAIETYIKSQPPEDQERLIERAKHGYAIDQVMRRYEAGNASGVPPAAWWRVLASAPARARAQEFHSKWLEASPADRRKMENIAFGMSRVGVSFASEDFKMELAREKKLLGEDQR